MVRTAVLALFVGCASTAPAPRVPSNIAPVEPQLVSVPTRWSIVATDQVGVIEGTAIDGRNHRPLVNAKIVARRFDPMTPTLPTTAVTDDHGSFRFSGRPDGGYTLEIYYDNAYDEHGAINIDHSVGARVDISLYQAPGPQRDAM